MLYATNFFVLKGNAMNEPTFSLKFEGDIPNAFQAANIVTKLIREGKGTSKRAVDHALYAMGEIHAALRPGDSFVPPVVGATTQQVESCTIDECCDQLEACLEAGPPGMQNAGEEQPEEQGNALVIFGLLMQILQFFRK